MRRLLLILALAACAPKPAPVVVAPPQLAATATAQRVVLVSFDGLGADMIAGQTNLPAFEALVRDGANARVVPVNPTQTSTAHVSILTGAQPRAHGIVSNRFHVAGTPPEQMASGHETDIDVETLVESARRQGKRVGVVPFPTVDGRGSRRRADFGFAWRSAITTPRTIRLTRGDFHREWVPPTWTARPQRRVSYSPVMRARMDWSVPDRLRSDVDLVAYDTTDDAAANYDLFLIESGEREIAPDSRGWFAISTQTTGGLYGSWSKILSAERSLSEVRIYWGAISRTDAWPGTFRTMLDTQIGFAPGEPDTRADTATFLEQMHRLADFLTRAQVLAIRGMQFDLLLAYQPLIDEAAHRSLDDANIMHDAFAGADRALAQIRAPLDFSRDALVVTGDHGLALIDTEVRVNRLLAERGFGPRWRAFASGNAAHLYRFEGPDDADAVIEALNATGWFEQVAKKGAEDHRNAGDVIAFARPNVSLTGSSEEPVVTKPSTRGQHGALNTHLELHTVLFAAGAGTPRGTFGVISQTRIARFVSQLLSIQPPAAAE